MAPPYIEGVIPYEIHSITKKNNAKKIYGAQSALETKSEVEHLTLSYLAKYRTNFCEYGIGHLTLGHPAKLRKAYWRFGVGHLSVAIK